MRKIIFLDIDNVLNCRTTKEKIPVSGYLGIENRLVKILRRITDETDAKIVLTSTWKEGWHEDYAKCKNWVKYLRNELKKEDLEILDITPEEKHWSNRGVSIKEWLAKNKTDEYVIIDDILFAEFIEFDLIKHFVKTNPKTGITEENAEKAIEILNGHLYERTKEELEADAWQKE